MQLLDGHTPPRKYDYLAVANVLLGGQSPPRNKFPWLPTRFLGYVVWLYFPWRVGSQGNHAWGPAAKKTIFSWLAKLGCSCLAVHHQEKFPWWFFYIPWWFLAAKKFLFCGSEQIWLVSVSNE
jgi:hypothetical protein